MQIKRLQAKTAIPAVDTALEHVHQAITRLSSAPLLDAQIIDGLSVAANTVRVPHTLGRPLRGWMVIRDKVDAKIYEAASQPTPKTDLYLSSTGTGNFSILVF
jgi:hypothetical protein